MVVFGETRQAVAKFWVKLQLKLLFSPSAPLPLGETILKGILDNTYPTIPDNDPTLLEIKALLLTQEKVKEAAYLFFASLINKVPVVQKWLEDCNTSNDTELDPSRFMAEPRDSLQLLLTKLAKVHGIKIKSPFGVIEKLTALLINDRALIEETLTALHLEHLRKEVDPLAGTMTESEKEKTVLFVLKPLYFFLQKKEADAAFQPSSLVEMAFEEVAWSEEKDVSIFLPLIHQVVSNLTLNNASDDLHLKLYKSLSTKPLFEPLREAYIKALPPGPQLDKLAFIPNRNGYRQKMRLEQEDLQLQLEEITQTKPTSVKSLRPLFPRGSLPEGSLY